MEIVKICILVLIVVVMTGSLPAFSREISLLITFCCCIVVSLYILKQVLPMVDYLKSMAQNIAFDGVDIVFKAVGIGFITQFVSDTATDCGNRTLANLMVFAGRFFIIMSSATLFVRIFEIIEYLT